MMTRKRSLMLLLAIFGLMAFGRPQLSLAIPTICGPFGALDLALTCGYTPFAGLPVEATTGFRDGRWDTSGDAYARTIAEHELLHAIGFTTGYALFNQHLDAIVSAVDRNFYSGTCAGTPRVCAGSVILTLLPNSNHADPAVAGQSLDLMKPEIPNPPFPAGYPQTLLDIAALESAFEWHGLGGIDISINNLTPLLFDAGELANLASAESAMEALFNGGLTTPPRNVFKWDVFESQAPEPPSLPLFGVGMAILLVVLREKSRFACVQAMVAE